MPQTRTLLARDLHAVSLDPFTLREAGECDLPAGTCVEGAAFAMREATETGREQITLRVVDPDGWVAMKRVAVSDLRQALSNEAC
jgi:hypothetical protein